VRLGSLSFAAETPLALAPLAGYTDAAFRMTRRAFGVELTWTEMVTADGLVRARPTSKGFRKTLTLLAAEPEDHPLVAQLFGKEPEVLAAACRVVEEHARIEAIDLNAGCPVRKVVNSGHGVALMRDPAQLGRIVAAMRAATRLPLIVKLRAGDETVNAVECAAACADAGADAVAVHPRTRGQLFGGRADWSVIAAVRRAVKIPVIGNGDVNAGADARRMVEDTGCDAVMIGRAAVARPWIFAQARAALAGGLLPPEPDGPAKLAILTGHGKLLRRYKGEERAGREIRKYALFMVRGSRGAAARRRDIATAPDLETLLARAAEVLLAEERHDG